MKRHFFGIALAVCALLFLTATIGMAATNNAANATNSVAIVGSTANLANAPTNTPDAPQATNAVTTSLRETTLSAIAAATNSRNIVANVNSRTPVPEVTARDIITTAANHGKPIPAKNQNNASANAAPAHTNTPTVAVHQVARSGPITWTTNELNRSAEV